MTDMWLERGRNGFLGVNIAEAYGGGGGGMADLAAVLEECAGAGAPLLMMVVSPAICGSIIMRCGTEEQKKQWLPGIADRSEEHTSELQSLMRSSYAVFCLKKQEITPHHRTTNA